MTIINEMRQFMQLLNEIDSAISDEEKSNIGYTGTIDQKLNMVKQNGLDLQFIHNPDIDIIMAAIKQNGNALMFVRNPTDEMIMAALPQNVELWAHIKRPANSNSEDYKNYVKYTIFALKNGLDEKWINRISPSLEKDIIQQCPELQTRF